MNEGNPRIAPLNTETSARETPQRYERITIPAPTGLRVYSIEGHGNYGGGIVVAAATSPERAAEMGNKLSSSVWNVHYRAEDAVELHSVTPVGEGETVIAHYEMGE